MRQVVQLLRAIVIGFILSIVLIVLLSNSDSTRVLNGWYLIGCILALGFLAWVDENIDK